MLRSLHINSLFGIYTYHIDLLGAQGALKFITSPNGYGKTTILTLIDAFFAQDWNYFRIIPFHSISYDFVDYEIVVSQIHGVEHRGNVDEVLTDVNCLEIKINTGEKSSVEKIYFFDKPIDKDSPRVDVKTNSLQLFPNIGPCYFIHDNRLRKTNVANLSLSGLTNERHSVIANTIDLAKRLQEVRNRLLSITSNLEFASPIGEKDYQNAFELLNVFNEQLLKYGLLEKNLLTEYRADNAVYLGALVKALNTAYQEINPFIQKLNLFSEIIKRSEFAYKRMDIHLRYGYRFVAENKEHTILSTLTLSSGEQHLMIMAYELLFVAPEESLILLDEPELSFHYAWQSKFLYNLLDIQKLRPKLQWIICTHSPQIFGRKWDLSVDLYGLQKELEKQ